MSRSQSERQMCSPLSDIKSALNADEGMYQGRNAEQRQLTELHC